MSNFQKLKELQFFFDFIPDLACVLQPEGTFEMLNPVWEQVTGWKSDTLKSLPWIEFVHPDDIPVTQECLHTLLNQSCSSSVVNFENRWLHKDGSFHRLAWRVSLGEGRLLYAIAREISPLNPNLQQLQIELKQAQEALLRSEEHFAKAFRVNLLPACITTWQEGRFIDANDSLIKLSGYSREELIGHTAMELGLWVSVEDRSRVFQLLQEQKPSFNVEVRYRTKLGEIRNGVASFEVVEINGETCVLSQTYDVTKYKQAEETIKASLQEKEVLLREIHHRVKNNLQIISSLLDLQSQNTNEPTIQAVFRESCNRVRSMALVHETLYQSPDCAKVNFTEYLENLISQLFQAYRVNADKITLEKDLGEVMLSIDIAIPCGLIINELVSNALEHAFPNQAEGTIYITLHSDQDEYCVLTVRDNGIGLPRDIKDDSFISLGLKLVSILTKQLEGTLDLDRQKGTEFCLRFPQST